MTSDKFINNISDPARYEKDWLPKVLAYREKLDQSILKEYLAPKELVPESLDVQFNATEIPYKVLSKKDIEITDSSAVKLVAEMASGKLTAVEVLTAFVKRATLAHQFTHCAMEFLVEEGLARAKELDEIFAKTGKTVGPLHGLPISLKEHFGMKDRVTHGCYVAFIENIPKKDATTIEVLREAGAVFYIRTSEPQSLMHECSDNNITGRTANPYNTSLSPGGSSSGEGACIAMGGSPIGVGTDIGGSIRAPAAYSGGMFGFKPTTRRISMAGCVSAGAGQETVYCAMGPMARNAEDINLFMKAYAEMEPWKKDANIIALPWKDVPSPKPKELTVAIMYEDGVVRPHPPIERALKHAEEKLIKAGVNVIKWEPHRCKEAFEQCLKAYTADGNFHQKQALGKSGEPILPLTEFALSMGLGDEGISVHENHLLNAFRDEIRQEYLDLMNEKKVDIILSPTYVGTAPRPGTIKYWNYCSLWNILDMPGIVFPTGLFQDPSIDVKDSSYKTRNEYEEYEYNLYEPEYFTGAPLSLQLTGRRYDDEAVVKAADIIEKIVSAA